MLFFCCFLFLSKFLSTIEGPQFGEMWMPPILDAPQPVTTAGAKRSLNKPLPLLKRGRKETGWYLGNLAGQLSNETKELLKKRTAGTDQIGFVTTFGIGAGEP